MATISPLRLVPGKCQVALETELDRSGIEGLAVLERDAAAQRERQRLVVIGPGIVGSELRHDLERRADVEELVAHRDQNDARHQRARQRWIERIRIFGESDAQRLCRGRCGQHGKRDRN
jgi:hypothetical protein